MIVDLEPTEDQQAIAEGIAELLKDCLPVARLREEAAHGGSAERAQWQQLSELGLFSLGVAEADGGMGLGLAEEVLAACAMGANLLSPSVLAQAVAAHAAPAGLRPAIASGETRVAFAAAVSPDEALLIDADDADQVLVLGEGASIVPRSSLDPAAAVAGLDETVAFARTSASYPRDRDAAADRISLLIAAYLVGVASAVTDMAVEYAGTREQFGQPIGGFQAIKHMCADMAVQAAAADAQVRHAAITFGTGSNDRREIATARLLASKAAIANAKANIQIHGGMGFTAECDAHLFLKRAHVMASLGSSTRAEERRILT